MRWLRSPEPTCRRRDSACAAACLAALVVQQTRLEQAQRTGAVLVLAALILAFDHDAGGQVGDADGRVGLVDVLATGAGGAERVGLEVGRIDLDVVDLIHLGQDRHRGGRSVDAPLRLGFRHALDAMRARLEFQPRIRALALDARHHFLVATVFAVRFR